MSNDPQEAAALAAVEAEQSALKPARPGRPQSEETRQKQRDSARARQTARQAEAAQQAAQVQTPEEHQAAQRQRAVSVAAAAEQSIRDAAERPKPNAQEPARRAGVDPLIAATTKKAREIIAAEEKERNLRMEMVQKGLDPTKIPPSPYKLRRQQVQRDQTQLTYADGTPIPVPAGMFPRWVRTTDAFDRPVDQRVGEFLAYGGDVVKDPTSGEPVTRWDHVLIFTPLDGYAERTHAHMPDGALSGQAAFDRVAEYAAYANRINGVTAVRVGMEAEDGEVVEQTRPQLPTSRPSVGAGGWTAPR